MNEENCTSNFEGIFERGVLSVIPVAGNEIPDSWFIVSISVLFAVSSLFLVLGSRILKPVAVLSGGTTGAIVGIIVGNGIDVSS